MFNYKEYLVEGSKDNNHKDYFKHPDSRTNELTILNNFINSMYDGKNYDYILKTLIESLKDTAIAHLLETLRNLKWDGSIVDKKEQAKITQDIINTIDNKWYSK